jgi:hypothetical protein
MAKKRLKSIRPKYTNSRKRQSIWWQLLIIIVLSLILVTLILLVIFGYANQEKEKSPCEKLNNSCFTSCPSGYGEVDMGCFNGNVCCKEIKNPSNKIILSGFVKLKQGNCMPPTNSATCKEDSLDTYVGVFPLVPQSDLDNFYYRTTIEPIKSERSIKNGIIGYYEIEVQKGNYSVFAKDPLNNNDYYCNDIDVKGNACSININNESVSFDITIDHAIY